MVSDNKEHSLIEGVLDLPRRDIVEIRRANLTSLIDSYETQAYFAERIGKPASYVSQLKKGFGSNGKAIGMGNNVARDIEQALNLPFGWMDLLHDDDIGAQKAPAIDHSSYADIEHVVVGQPSKYPLVHIEYLNMQVCCGHGYSNTEFPEAHTQLFSVEFLRANNLPVDGKGLVLMHACGDSMWHTISNGTVILVNKKESDLSSLLNNRIYVFDANGEMICKRVIKNLDGSIILKSDNPNKSDYPDQPVTQQNFVNLSLIGRVRYVFMQL